MGIKKISNDRGVLYYCRSCGAYNIESVEWVKNTPSTIKCTMCNTVLEFY